MNYIKKLEKEKKIAEDTLKAMQNEITQFRIHLNSSKFNTDTTIQVADVHRYLDNIANALPDYLKD